MNFKCSEEGDDGRVWLLLGMDVWTCNIWMAYEFVGGGGDICEWYACCVTCSIEVFCLFKFYIYIWPTYPITHTLMSSVPDQYVYSGKQSVDH